MSGNLANSSAEPSYISRLALSATPFSALADPQLFFGGEHIEQRLNLLLHLLRSSDKVGVVFAEQGIGKSSVLSQLQQRAADDLRLCRIDADSSLIHSKLITQCMQSFGADIHDMAEPESVLKNRLLRLRQLNIKSVLMIDNIEELSAEALAKVIDLLSWQDEDGFLLQAIFSADKVMAELGNLHGRLQRVDLPALTEEELPLYLSHRLSAVGYKGELPFSSKDLKQFYRHSSGNPAHINQLAHQQLLGLSSRTKLSPINLKIGSLLSWFKWLAVALLLLSLVLLLIFQDGVNSFFATSPSESNIEIVLPQEQEAPLATIIVGDEKIVSSEQAERDELTLLLTELSVEEPRQSSDTAEMEHSADLTRDKPLSPVVEQAVDIIEPSIHHHEWLKQQDGTNYTFQLMGSWQHDEVVEFVEQYALTGDVAEFESIRNGRIWYALVYGVYSNKQQALNDSKQWPAPLNTLPSWLRRFDSVQKQIKDRPQAQ